jgi:hypothetical protein
MHRNNSFDCLHRNMKKKKNVEEEEEEALGGGKGKEGTIC